MQVDVLPEAQGGLVSLPSQSGLDSSLPSALLKGRASSSLSRPSPADSTAASAAAAAAAGEATQAPSRVMAGTAAAAAPDAGAAASGFAAAAACKEGAPVAAAQHAPPEGVLGAERSGSGLLRYRAPIDPQQRGKLESFDRKIGRAANALRVRLLPAFGTRRTARSTFGLWQVCERPQGACCGGLP